MIAYFVTCGGPFGFEAVIGSGGAVLSVVGLIVIVCVWCLPQALMSAELAMLCNSNGGAIVWSERAFGGGLSFLSMCNLLFSNICSVTLSLVLFIRYFAHYLDDYPIEVIFWIKFGVKLGVLIASCIVCAAGPKVVSWLSFIIGVILFAPFLCMLVVLGVNGSYASELQCFYFYFFFFSKTDPRC